MDKKAKSDNAMLIIPIVVLDFFVFLMFYSTKRIIPDSKGIIEIKTDIIFFGSLLLWSVMLFLGVRWFSKGQEKEIVRLREKHKKFLEEDI